MVTVTFLNPGVITDPYSGEEIESWDSPTETIVEGCVLAPRASNEPLQVGRDSVYVGYMLYAPYDVPVTARSRVVIGDRTYEVKGEPFHWKHPMTGTEAGTEIAIDRVDG